MNDEQRHEIIRRLSQGKELSPEWARILFPPKSTNTAGTNQPAFWYA